MQFLYPQFLFALFALAIPVIIHLFNFRRYKKVLFTNVRFISDVQQEQKSRNKLRHLLILAMRMLAIAFIVLAFAQPFFAKQGALVNPGKKYVSIYLDNSFSMSNVGSEGELLELAKRKATEITKAYKESDAFQLVTNDFELRHKRWLNRPEFLQELNDVKISPAFRSVSDVYRRMEEGFREAENANKTAYMLSDFQEPMADFGKLKKDTSIALTVLPLRASKQNNVYLDSAWFESALWQLNKPNTLDVSLVNASNEDVEDGTVTLNINGRQKALASYKIAAKGKTTVRLVYTITEAGANTGVLNIEDYPVTFDNQLFFSYNVAQNIPVLVINASAPDPNIVKAFAAENTFVVDNVSEGNIDYSALKKYSFIILNELQSIPSGLSAALQDFLTTNGNVLLIPPVQDLDMPSYSSFATSVSAFSYAAATTANNIALSAQDLQKPFFRNVFEEVPRDINMPSVSKYYTFSGSTASAGDVLLRMNDGNTFLNMTSVGRGNLFSLAVPLAGDWSNLTSHALFLPMLYKMAFYKQQEDQLYYVIGQDNYIQLPNLAQDQGKIYKLVKDSTEIIPPQRVVDGKLSLFVENLILEAGHYGLFSRSEEGSAQKAVKVYSFNYNRKESAMQFLTDDQMKELSGRPVNIIDAGKTNIAGVAEELQKGTPLWKWCIIAALLFLLTETLLIRFWK